MRPNWIQTTLGEIAGHSLGKMLDKSKNRGQLQPYLRNLNVRWFEFDLSDLSEMRFLPEELDRFSIQKGDLVVCEGGYPGRAAIWLEDRPIYFQKALHRIRCAESLSNRWALYHFYHLELSGEIRTYLSGTGIQHLTRESLHRIKIPVPPLPEQQRIVAILDEAFAAIATAKANAEKNLQNARALFQGELAALFAPSTQHPPVPLSLLLSEQPRNGWSPPAEFQTGGGTPVLTLSAVTGYYYNGSKVKMSSVPTSVGAHYWLKPGELLVTRSNTRELVGHVAIYDGTPSPAICCDLIMKMTVDPAKADTRYVYYAIRSPGSREYLTTVAHGASSTMKKIGKSVVQSIEIPYRPISEQKAIVEKLDTLRAETLRLESLYGQKLAALDELKKSLLHRAFNGDL